MHKLVWICMLGLCAGVAYGGTCSQAYQCQTTCYRTSTYYVNCGWFGWDWALCSRQRSVPYSCTKTCYRRVCCTGYIGRECNTPLCFGSTSCRNGGTCSSPDTCRCLSGFSSPQCNDVNECTQTNHGCQQGCVNKNGSYRCTCRSGYTLDTNLKGCLDLNECLIKNGGCEQVCNNNIGSFTCDCSNGYKLNTDGRTCSDMNECTLGESGCAHFCTNTVGSYTCSCEANYAIAVDGKLCEVNIIGEVQTSMHIDDSEYQVLSLRQSDKVMNIVSVYYPNGKPLYLDSVQFKDTSRLTIGEFNGHSQIWDTDLDECDVDNGNCDHICINQIGSYSCECFSGYRMVDGSSITRNECQDLDECDVSNGNCDHICINQVGSYRCECFSGYRMVEGSSITRNECQDIDECAEQTSGCSQICTNSDGLYSCSCNNGYSLDHDDKTCIDADDCEVVTCQNGGSCIDGLGSFSCACVTGFTGLHCQTDINECDLSNGGCQDICVNTIGTFACSCSEGVELESDGFSCLKEEAVTVFERLQIPKQLLPKACFAVSLVQCTDGNDIDIHLTSTSEWYRLNSNHDIIYTLGIVFVKVNNFSVPVSLRGIEVTLRSKEFILTFGKKYNLTEGTSIENDLTHADCQLVELVGDDLYDFIREDSFTKTFLLSLFPALPDWLQFEKSSTEILSVQDIRSDLVYGRNMDDVKWCTGAPVLSDHLYAVFRFDTGFKLSVLDDEVNFPKTIKSKKFCFIVDLCQSYGGTVFLMIPEGYRDSLSELSVFRALKEDQNIHIEPRGIGISLVNGISAVHHTLSRQLWNGEQMFMPLLPQVDFWVGGNLMKNDRYFTVEGNADVYMRIPNTQTMLSTMFLEEWTGAVDIELSVSPIIRFKLFGKEYSVTLQLVTATISAYVSIGGSAREWCGEVSNPQGVFMSALVEINPFKNIPFLEDFAIISTNRLYAFVTTDPNVNSLDGMDITIQDDILKLDNLLRDTETVLYNAEDNIEMALSDTLKERLAKMKQSVVMIRNTINENLVYVSSVTSEELIGYLEHIRQNFYKFKSAVTDFADEIEFIIDEAKQNLIDLLHNHTSIISEVVKHIFNKITESSISSAGNYTVFGLKYSIDLNIFKLKLPGLDIEIVYSEGDLFSCSRFHKIKQLLGDESALRFIGRASKEYSLGRFLRYEQGFGIGGAFAINSDKVLIQLQAFINMIGIKVTGDLFISRSGIDFYLEGNVWDIFLAQIEVTAEVGKEWYQLTFNLRGRFVAQAKRKRHARGLVSYRYPDMFQNSRNRRQIQTDSSSFQSSYLDALKKAINLISRAAQERLSQAQSALSSAQKGLTKAQSWLDEKQKEIMAANVIFDNAVKSFETAKERLEAAKGPLNYALKSLKDAQRDVANLCSFSKCSHFCIPGIKCGICWLQILFVSIPVPCCELTSCMIRIPDLLCVFANIACGIVRAAAYLILEIAKIFVRTAMLAFDVAKAGITVAQFVVDKSRMVLTIAQGILELAKIGLEVAKGLLEAAKIALETVKHVIGAAFKVLEFVIEYGLKNIIDLRNCGFNIELSTKDLPVFEVFCEVNAFNLGWTSIKLKINFKNLLQSIWQAARATIDAIINILGGNFSGRKRRDIEFDASSKMHVLLRKIRESGRLNNTDTYLNQTIDIVNSTMGFHGTDDSDTENRVEIFREKCKTITKIQEFMQYAFESLHYVINESKSYIQEIENVKKELQRYNNIASTANITIKNVEISKENASKDYNMTDEDLDKVINETKSAAADDPLLVEMRSAVNISVKNVDTERKSVESVDYVSAWFTLMKNMTRDYFNETECDDFRDCVFFSISSLYDLYEYEDLPNITHIKESILELENILIETFQNESSSILGTSVAMEYVLSHIDSLVEMNLFCAELPKFMTQLTNNTVLYGSNVQFFCHVAGDPEPRYIWLKNDTVIAGENMSTITVHNVTDKNAFDKYNCIAGNVVANITSDDAYITVVLEDEDECETENGNCDQLCNNTVGSYICLCYEGYEPQEEKKNLCKDKNECQTNNGGCQHKCTNEEASYTCSCNEGYKLQAGGRTCIDINECQTNNGGCQHKCINEEGLYTCSCNEGYQIHADDRTCIDINECETNNGGCQHKCTNEEGSYTCSCNEGYQLYADGRTCIDIYECETNNGGCQQKCTNKEGSYMCSCNEGYQLQADGRTCIDINECEINNGGCQQKCTNEEGSYTCSCNEGYQLQADGRTCTDINECETNNGGCQHQCTNEQGSYMCSCNEGYKLHAGGRTCIDINECEINNDGCQHTCTNEEGSYTCSCYEGYQLQADGRTCIDINECETNNGGCQHTCTNEEGSYTCSCNEGYQINADGRTCTDINECEINNGGCQHKCTNEEGSYTCSCNEGYQLQADGRTCIDINECQTNNGGCQHTCTNEEGSYTCSCNEGNQKNADGRTCTDINECKTTNGGCQHTCTNKEGSYTCSCNEGYQLNADGRTCTDRNECETNNGGCQHQCTNGEGSFMCSCNEGYQLYADARTCTDINECETNNGGCQHKCTHEDRSYTCSCYEGYQLQADGRTCINMNVCEINNGGCQHKCTNEEGSYTCSCNEGYQLHADARTCIDNNECETNNGGCQHTCTNVEGSYTCSCNEGYQLHADGRTCTDINECETNNGGCKHKCTNEEGFYSCSCNEGYQFHIDGRTCEDINECKTNNGGCQQTCTNEGGYFTCSCKSGYELHTDKKTCLDTNECKTNNGGCQQICVNAYGSFTCSCNDGFQIDDESKACIHINECEAKSGKCQHGCINEKGSVRCTCKEGYELLSDDVSCRDINECEADNGKCEHTCLNFIGSHTCLCQLGSILEKNNMSCRDVSRNAVSSSIKLYVDEDTEVSNQSVYVSVERMLNSHFKTLIDGTLTVYINNLRRGSIIADYTVVYQEEQNVHSTADAIFKAILDLEAGATLILGGKSVKAQTILPSNSTDLCDIRALLAGQCEEGWHCVLEGDGPICRKVSDESSSDSGIKYIYIVAPVAGSILLAILLAIIIVRARYLRHIRRNRDIYHVNAVE